MFVEVLSRLAGVLLLSGAYPARTQTLSFLPHRDIPMSPGNFPGQGCCVVVSGDFNGDGKPDLVVSFGTGTLVLLLGDGAGGFKPGVVLATFSTGVAGPLAADVNRDGKLDLLVGSGLSDQPQTYLLLGRRDGTFQSVAQPVASGYPLVVADLDGDGKPDLVTRLLVGPCRGQVQLGNGDGTFQKPLSACIPFVDSMSDNAVIGDFNGDGIPDLAWSGARSNGEFEIVFGNGDGTFRNPSASEIHPVSRTVPECEGANRPFAVGDLDHDGKLDLVAAGLGGCIAIYFGNGVEIVVRALDLLPAGGLQVSHSIFVADFNGDGNLDIANDNVVLLGNGDGTFQPARYFLTASPNAASLVAADLNGDGLPDLVYVNYDGPSVNGLSVLLNNTPGPPTSVIGYSAATGAGPVAPSSIGSVYGKNLARTTAAAPGATLPTQLGGISLRVRDSTDLVRLAPLLYVSPTQINFLVPDQTVLGPVVLTVDDGSSPLVETANATAVTQVAPAIFTVNGQGQGAAAATAVRVLADGTQQPVAVFNCSGPGQCTTVPINLAGGQAVYLSLYGTGFRGVRSPQQTRCTIGGVNAVVLFAGAQPTIPGLDQINILLPATLASGTAPVQCQFDFQSTLFSGLATTNPVQIEIK
jgi:uncharacterized protein (TIGR03437 family)